MRLCAVAAMNTTRQAHASDMSESSSIAAKRGAMTPPRLVKKFDTALRMHEYCAATSMYEQLRPDCTAAKLIWLSAMRKTERPSFLLAKEAPMSQRQLTPVARVCATCRTSSVDQPRSCSHRTSTRPMPFAARNMHEKTSTL